MVDKLTALDNGVNQMENDIVEVRQYLVSAPVPSA